MLSRTCLEVESALCFFFFPLESCACVCLACRAPARVHSWRGWRFLVPTPRRRRRAPDARKRRGRAAATAAAFDGWGRMLTRRRRRAGREPVCGAAAAGPRRRAFVPRRGGWLTLRRGCGASQPQVAAARRRRSAHDRRTCGQDDVDGLGVGPGVLAACRPAPVGRGVTGGAPSPRLLVECTAHAFPRVKCTGAEKLVGARLGLGGLLSRSFGVSPPSPSVPTLQRSCLPIDRRVAVVHSRHHR